MRLTELHCPSQRMYHPAPFTSFTEMPEVRLLMEDLCYKRNGHRNVPDEEVHRAFDKYVTTLNPSRGVHSLLCAHLRFEIRLLISSSDLCCRMDQDGNGEVTQYEFVEVFANANFRVTSFGEHVDSKSGGARKSRASRVSRSSSA